MLGMRRLKEDCKRTEEFILIFSSKAESREMYSFLWRSQPPTRSHPAHVTFPLKDIVNTPALFPYADIFEGDH